MAPTNAQGWSIPWAPSDASEFLFATGDLSRSLQVVVVVVVERFVSDCFCRWAVTTPSELLKIGDQVTGANLFT